MKQSLNRRNSFIVLLFFLFSCNAPVQNQSQSNESFTLSINQGDDAYIVIQEALIKASPGSTILLPSGKFSLSRSLSLTEDRVTLRGKGPNETILSFKEQTPQDNKKEGAQGLLVQPSGVILESFAIEDTKGDAIKVEDADGITFRNIRVEWTSGPSERNGSYGLYPVKSKKVLIEDCVAIGASDAGIYVGQSDTIIVRRNRAEGNVAGIEIENSTFADVYENVATNNTGGILIFDLPNLPKQGGQNTRVYNNQIRSNNAPNFAPKGAIVASVPSGVGIMILANDNVEIFNNILEDNQTTSVLITSYLFAVGEFDDPAFDPFPESISIHDNQFAGSGTNPTGQAVEPLIPLLGTPFPDILYDGIVDQSKFDEGELPNDLRICATKNGDASFINLHAYEKPIPKPEKNPVAHTCQLPPLDPIILEENE